MIIYVFPLFLSVVIVALGYKIWVCLLAHLGDPALKGSFQRGHNLEHSTPVLRSNIIYLEWKCCFRARQNIWWFYTENTVKREQYVNEKVVWRLKYCHRNVTGYQLSSVRTVKSNQGNTEETIWFVIKYTASYIIHKVFQRIQYSRV